MEGTLLQKTVLISDSIGISRSRNTIKFNSTIKAEMIDSDSFDIFNK